MVVILADDELKRALGREEEAGEEESVTTSIKDDQN